MLICGRFYYDPNGFVNAIINTSDSIAAMMHTSLERHHENYRLNILRTFKTYPINWYGGNHVNLSEANAQVQTRLTHEYPRNVPISADVGQRMVDLETYNVQISNVGEHYEPSATGEITNGHGSIYFAKGQVLNPIGDVNINGQGFLVFEPERDGLLIMADGNGQFMHNIGLYHRGELLVSEEITSVMPKDLRVVKTTDVKQSTSAPQIKYEIKYNGLVEENMEFTYTDYTMGREDKIYAFPKTQHIINVNGVHIKVLNATENNIEYILLN
jgi:hypothetical protein